MSKILYPCIFYAISKTGIEVLNSLLTNSEKVSLPVYSKFIRSVYFDENNTISNSLNNEKLHFSLSKSRNKSENYIIVNQNRKEYVTIFEKLLNDIYTVDNKNYATENDFILEKPQIVILASIDNPELTPIIVPLLLSIDTLPQNPIVHFILLYNQLLYTELTKELAILKNSFFRELDSLKSKKPYVWLIDIINEKGINLKDKESLIYAIGLFIELLLTDSRKINSLAINYGIEQEKPCIYSTFGFSLLSFPLKKIREYIGIHVCYKELNMQCKEFDIKYERTQIKDEISKFFSVAGFENLPEKISKKDNNTPVFSKFSFDEKRFTDKEFEFVLNEKLGRIEDATTLPKTITNDFFHKVEEYDKTYINSTLIEITQALDESKKRELQNSTEVIDRRLNQLLDEKGKGVNYSLIFISNLGNNGGGTDNLLEGRFSELKTMINIQDDLRSRFIGDQIISKEKELRGHSDNFTNKLQLIEQYKNQINSAEAGLIRLEESVGIENPKYLEIKTQIESKWDQIKNLTAEIEQHKIFIEDLTFQIEKIKADFERDTYKEEIKQKRNQNNLEEISKFSEKIDSVDLLLAEKYEEKNKRIEARKKFIYYRLILIPLISLALFFLIQTILFYKTDWFSLKDFGIGVIIIGIMGLIYYVINIIKFLKIRKQYQDFLDEIKSTLSTKHDLLARYVILKNEIYQNNFNFERDLIALSMAKKLTEEVKSRQYCLEDFKKTIVNELENLKRQKESFSLNESSFEFSVVDKPEIEAIYDNDITTPAKIINGSGAYKLSRFFGDFLTMKNLNSIYNTVSINANEICKRKVEKESVKTILFNEAPSFSKNVNTRAKFKQIIDTSRPLLRTIEWPNLTSNDIPFTSNSLIGFNQAVYSKFLKDVDFGSVVFEENNDKLFGILSIKSNFPSFLIYDVETNEEFIRKGITKENKSKYFINENSYNHSLLPPLDRRDKDDKGNLLMGNELIVALSTKLVTYDLKKNKFVHPIIGDLGFSIEDLLNTWSTPVCYEIIEKAKERDIDIWQYDENELKAYSAEFKKFWMNFPIVLPLKFVNELSEYFFSIKGAESDWDEIRKSLKATRKNSN